MGKVEVVPPRPATVPVTAKAVTPVSREITAAGNTAAVVLIRTLIAVPAVALAGVERVASRVTGALGLSMYYIQ